MPKIVFELEPGDGSLVNIELELFSYRQDAGGSWKKTKHVLDAPSADTGTFTFQSKADLPIGEYGIWLHLFTAGMSAKLRVKDAERVEPADSDWDYELKVPGGQTKISDSCYFQTGVTP